MVFESVVSLVLAAFTVFVLYFCENTIIYLPISRKHVNSKDMYIVYLGLNKFYV